MFPGAACVPNPCASLVGSRKARFHLWKAGFLHAITTTRLRHGRGAGAYGPRTSKGISGEGRCMQRSSPSTSLSRGRLVGVLSPIKIQALEKESMYAMGTVAAANNLAARVYRL